MLQRGQLLGEFDVGGFVHRFLVAAPDRGEIVDQALRLLGELHRLLVLERDDDFAVLHARVAVLARNDVDETREQPLQARDVGRAEKIGQRGLDPLAPGGDSREGRGCVVRQLDRGQGERRGRGGFYTRGLKQRRGERRQRANFRELALNIRRRRVARCDGVLQLVEKLPGARHLPADIFAREGLRHARRTNLAGLLLQEQRAIVGVAELGQRDQRPPRPRLFHLAGLLAGEHLQGGNLLQPRPALADLPGHAADRGAGKIGDRQRPGRCRGEINRHGLPRRIKVDQFRLGNGAFVSIQDGAVELVLERMDIIPQSLHGSRVRRLRAR